MEAEVVKASGPSAWSWARTRETAMVLAAMLACFGVLIAGMSYAVQPVREDLRVLQATMGNVRERLVGVEVEVGSLKEELGGLKSEVGSLKNELASVKDDVASLKAGQARILALLEGRASGT